MSATIKGQKTREHILKTFRKILLAQGFQNTSISEIISATGVKDLNLAGYTDWRLPTVNELYNLNYNFDLHLNGECDLVLQGRYWSGENDGEGIAGSWEISNQCDPPRRYFSGTSGHVRAVRL